MTTAPASRPLVARTVPLSGAAVAELGGLLDLLPREQAAAWVRGGQGLVGWGEAARIETGGPERFADAAAAWADLNRHAVVRDEVNLPGTGPVAFGSFAFSDASAAGGVLVVPEVVVGCRDGVWWVTTIGLGSVPRSVRPAPADGPQPPRGVAFSPGAQAPDEWAHTVAAAIDRITAGEVEKVVLARDVIATAQAPVDPRALLRRLAADYPGCWTFTVDGLLGATPEMLVRLERGLVTSRVLAGTIRRSDDPAREADDLRLAASLARSSKDLEEHEYAVRSVAEALAPFCATTNVPESPFVLHLANVMHLATEISGVLRDSGSTSLDLAARLHPSAAVCGTPTKAAADLIDELERMDRDRYAGPVGWMDADGDGEWGIALRCARIDADDDRRLRLFAGCGIVAGSDPAAELAESEAKLLPMRMALD
ncbi:isochorismate synthase MenF [Spongisporangium articulatum]|uniref:isochorismate synthase n=1 Tax=Spongisporangium articulatum TaxID=3362603 RepID=A0ABW8ANQ3_9ACTN